MPTYMSDIITDDEIAKWKFGDNILIQGGTGCGKSTFILQKLLKYASSKGLRICMFSNRAILRLQNLRIARQDQQFIEFTNYQSVESMSNESRISYLRQFSYLIMDEAHYFYSDSLFNERSSTLLDLLSEAHSFIKIYMTATPHVLRRYLTRIGIQHEYVLPLGVNEKINKIHFRDNMEDILCEIETLPTKEKALIFCSDVHAAYNYAQEFASGPARFICSINNKDFGQALDLNTYGELLILESFGARALFSTSVMYNGINIKDRKLRLLATDIFDDISLIQCIGRKRQIDAKDVYDLWIKIPSKKTLTMRSNYTARRLRSESMTLVQTEQCNYLTENIEAIRNEGFVEHVRNLLGVSVFKIDYTPSKPGTSKRRKPTKKRYSPTYSAIYEVERDAELLPYIDRIIYHARIPEFCKVLKVVAARHRIYYEAGKNELPKAREAVIELNMGLSLRYVSEGWWLYQTGWTHHASDDKKLPHRSTILKNAPPGRRKKIIS